MAIAIELWAKELKNKRVVIFCDNTSVVCMINESTSSCKLCMFLIRQITITSMEHNVRFFAKHISGKKNVLADSLSRLKIGKFKKLAHLDIDPEPTALPNNLWPIPRNWWD